MIFDALIVGTFSPAEWQTNVQPQEPELLLRSDYEVALRDDFWVVLLGSVGVVVVAIVVVVVAVVAIVVVALISASRTLAFALTRIATAGAMASTRHVLK
jgi:hypothetical protein